MVSSDDSLDLALGLSRLATHPGTAARILEVTRAGPGSLDDLIGIVRLDPALAARVLGVANTGSFEFRSEIRTLEQACSIMGPTVLSSLLLTFTLASEAEGDAPLAPRFRRIWERSVVRAVAAEGLERVGGQGPGRELYAAALLADLGSLAMLQALGCTWEESPDGATPEEASTRGEKAEAVSLHPAEVTGELLDRLAIPPSLGEAIRAGMHTEEGPPGERPTGAPEYLATGIRLASIAVDWLLGDRDPERYEVVAGAFGEELGVDRPGLDLYMGEVDRQVRALIGPGSHFHQVVPRNSSLFARASERLAALAINEHRQRRRTSTLLEMAEARTSEIRAQNKRLRERAERDPLTGLYNRRLFEDALRRELRRAGRSQAPVAVLFVDVDHFKALNDTQGHSFGDRILVSLSELLQDVVRGSDVVARFGGEEFLVLAPGVDGEKLWEMADRIRRGSERLGVRESGGPVVTVSVGGASIRPDGNDCRKLSRTVRSILDMADQAMYQSKRRGRNRITICTSEGAILYGFEEGFVPRPGSGPIRAAN